MTKSRPCGAGFSFLLLFAGAIGGRHAATGAVAVLERHTALRAHFLVHMKDEEE
jgi:hypothetical protein